MENKIQSEYDIVIVGAGPAGCIAAKYLSDNFSVLLLDKNKMPRDKTCGGVLVEEAQDFIKKNLPVIPKSVFSSPEKLDMRNIDWNNNAGKDIKRGFYNINRINFDYWLFKLCEKSVSFSSQIKFFKFEKRKESINIIIEKDNKEINIKSKYLIGADGALSTTKKSLDNKQIRQYIAIQEFIKPKDKSTDKFLFIYDNDITDFYSWVIPKNDNLVIGSALLKENPNKKFQLFKNKLKEKLGISGLISKKEGAVINRPKNREDIYLGNENIFLIGEAAGLISSSTAEGISFALRSGFNCAKAIIDNSKNPLRTYQDLSSPLVDEISSKLKKSEMLSNPVKRKKYFSEM